MAIKGNSYSKTTWAFQERPVTSTKLNMWDDRIESALELAYFLLNMAWGGGNGVVRNASSFDLQTVAKSPPAMHVAVKPGYAFIAKYPFKLGTTTDTVDFAAPSAHPRIDLVQARLDTWSIGVKIGVEAISPAAPVPDADCIALAEVHLRPGMTCVKDADDSVNGYIMDVRAFL